MNDGSCWVGFLRAVNVGGRTVTMAELRQLLEGRHAGTVSTFLASGNVIFEGAKGGTAALEARIEAALLGGLGYPIEAFVRSIGEVAALAAAPVFSPAAGVAVHVGFLRSPPDPPALRALRRMAGSEDRVEVQGRQLWWRREGRVSESPLATAALGRALGQPATLRSLRTLERLAARYRRPAEPG